MMGGPSPVRQVCDGAALVETGVIVSHGRTPVDRFSGSSAVEDDQAGTRVLVLRSAGGAAEGQEPLSPPEVCSVRVDIDRFYSDLLHELGCLAVSGGSAAGAAAVAKRVALQHGIRVAERIPLPRLNRAELERLGRRGVSRARAWQGEQPL